MSTTRVTRGLARRGGGTLVTLVTLALGCVGLAGCPFGRSRHEGPVPDVDVGAWRAGLGCAAAREPLAGLCRQLDAFAGAGAVTSLPGAGRAEQRWFGRRTLQQEGKLSVHYEVLAFAPRTASGGRWKPPAAAMLALAKATGHVAPTSTCRLGARCAPLDAFLDALARGERRALPAEVSTAIAQIGPHGYMPLARTTGTSFAAGDGYHTDSYYRQAGGELLVFLPGRTPLDNRMNRGEAALGVYQRLPASGP